MRFRQRRRTTALECLSNFAFTIKKALVGMLLITVVFMGMKAMQDGVKPNAEYTITIHWPEGNDDVDMWVLTPVGNVVRYNKPEYDFVHLERDDLGDGNDMIVVDGKTVREPKNSETVAIRTKMPGEYVVNLVMYRPDLSRSVVDGQFGEPIPVKVEVKRINPNVSDVFNTTVKLLEPKQELHVLRFTVNADGTVTDITRTLPISLVEAAESRSPK